MKVQNLRDNYPKLIFYMETNGYSKTYVARFKREIKKIISAESKEWSCYTDVYLEYTKASQSPDYLRDKRTVIGAIEQFDVHDRYPNGRRRHQLFERGSYPLLSPEFKSIINLYREVEKNVAKKKLLPFIQNLIMQPHFFYPSSKKELTAWKRLQRKPCFQYLCPRMKHCLGVVLTKKI